MFAEPALCHMGAAFLRCGPGEPVPGVPGATCCPAAPGPGPAQAGRNRSDVTVQRLSPVHRHIATVTGAAARPGTGQRAGPRRLVRGMRHREPLAWPRGHQAALTPKKPRPCGVATVGPEAERGSYAAIERFRDDGAEVAATGGGRSSRTRREARKPARNLRIRAG